MVQAQCLGSIRLKHAEGEPDSVPKKLSVSQKLQASLQPPSLGRHYPFKDDLTRTKLVIVSEALL